MLPNGQPATRQAEAKLSATAQFQMEATLQKDAFLVFRALCKLSVRASETATGTDMTAIRGKVSVQASLLHPRRKSGQQCSSVLAPVAGLTDCTRRSKKLIAVCNRTVAFPVSILGLLLVTPPGSPLLTLWSNNVVLQATTVWLLCFRWCGESQQN